MVTTSVTGQGGLELGGTAPVEFVHGTGQADADLVVEWDFDGDGDFDLPEEDITAYVLEAESMTGRDFPSQLTGKAGPGQLKLRLLNTDGRFSYFNTASPLTQDGLSLKTGRRIRVRTADAANPDPVLLARDRFLGTGVLGHDELDETWVRITGPAFDYQRQGDSAGRTLAVTTAKGSPCIAWVTVGDDIYAQVRVAHFDTNDNRAGIVYRFEDTDDYGVLYVTGSTLELGEFNAGVFSSTASVDIEHRDDITIGVLVDGTDVTAYLEGVEVASGTAFSSSSNNVGIYGLWEAQRPVSFDEFYVWDRLPAETEGILWTGRVAGVVPSSEPGAPAFAEVTAEGPLLDAAAIDITPPRSIGSPSDPTGMTTGLLVGADLASAQLLHPPGPISAGDVTTGSVGLAKSKALDALRSFEEVEFGFLYETQEGGVGFEGRGDRLDAPVAAVFSDAPGAQFGYTALQLGDWRRDVTNRVTARIAPGVPEVVAFVSTANTASGDTSVTYPLPNSGDGAEVGDLLIVFIAATVGSSGQEWLTPIGWKSYRDAKDFIGKLRIYAKVIEQGDLGSTVLFYDDPANVGGSWIARTFLVSNWYGSLDEGVVVAEPTGLGQPNTFTQARNGENHPPTVFPSWGPAPSLFISIRAGMTSSVGATVASVTDDTGPHGFGNVTGTFLNGALSNGADVAMQRALRQACVEVESPSAWASGATVFGGFEFVEVTTVAVRGFAGDPPETSGGQVVQVDDTVAQAAYGSILTHDNPGALFASEDDASAYGQAVLTRYADDRPIFALTFPATISSAYRAQALRRRVSDKIRLVAENGSAMGVNGEFFVENVVHRWGAGGKVWTVTWQLSPA